MSINSNITQALRDVNFLLQSPIYHQNDVRVRTDGQFELRHPLLKCKASNPSTIQRMKDSVQNILSCLNGLDLSEEDKKILFFERLSKLNTETFDRKLVNENKELKQMLAGVFQSDKDTGFFNKKEKVIRLALKLGIEPDRGSGCSGSYLLKDLKNQRVAIFKPSNEDTLSPTNPYITQKIKLQGVKALTQVSAGGSMLQTIAGQGYLAEVLASEYASLIKEDGIRLVPETRVVTLVINGQEMTGSLQLFIREPFEDLMQYCKFQSKMYQRGSSTISHDEMLSKIPQQFFEEIVIIKYLLGDNDSHAENVLVKTDNEGVVQGLISIDAGWSHAPQHPQVKPEQEKYVRVAMGLPHGDSPFGDKAKSIINKLVSLSDEMDSIAYRIYEGAEDKAVTEERINRRKERLGVLVKLTESNLPIKLLAEMDSKVKIENFLNE